MAQRRENRRKSSLAFPYEPDSERGRFIRFMDESGVVQLFIEVFHALYNEPIKPENPIEWIRQYLWSRAGQSPEGMRSEIERLRDEVIQVATEYEEIKSRLQDQQRGRVGKAAEAPTAADDIVPAPEATPARDHCGDSSRKSMQRKDSKGVHVQEDEPPPPPYAANNEEEEEVEVEANPTAVETPAMQEVQVQHRLRFSPEGEPLADHSTETSPQPSSYQFGDMDNEEEEEEEEAHGEETGQQERSHVAATADEDGSIATTRRSKRSRRKSKSIKSNTSNIEVFRGKRSPRSKIKHGHGGGKGGSGHDKSKSQLHVSDDEEEEEEAEERQEAHVQSSTSRILAIPGLDYNPCSHFSENCIGPEFWTRQLSYSLGPLEPESDTTTAPRYEDIDSLFYENIIMATRSQVEKPQALLKTTFREASKSKSESVEEFSWLPSILDAGAGPHLPSNWSEDE